MQSVCPVWLHLFKSHTLTASPVLPASFFPFVFGTRSAWCEPISVIFFSIYIIHYELISQISQLQSLHSAYVPTFEWMSSQVENEFISVWLYYRILEQANREQCFVQENKEQLFIEMSSSPSSVLPSVAVYFSQCAVYLTHCPFRGPDLGSTNPPPSY